MKVYKFGGASIATPQRVQGILPIVNNANDPLVLVVSALGKTTNALEKILNEACKGNKESARELVALLRQQHLEYAHELLGGAYAATADTLGKYFAELEKAADEADDRYYDRSYDQVVCMGELFSTIIVHAYLAEQGLPFQWVDARTVIRTDDTYRDAAIDWDRSAFNAQNIMGGMLAAGHMVITQGFIGGAWDGTSVTLGREGSDYTAAVLAAMLNASSLTIWKDVEGLRNADPKMFSDTVVIDEITYNEVIEMAFYGAQIIHPKTIKPLQNNNIPLYVKCFLDPSLKGSVIHSTANDAHYPPLIVLKEHQVLVQATTRDFSFITEENLSRLYAAFSELKIKINLIQNAAISFVACIDNRADKISVLREHLHDDYRVTLNEGVTILTIRHYTAGKVDELTAGRQILLRQETRKTLQVVMA